MAHFRRSYRKNKSDPLFSETRCSWGSQNISRYQRYTLIICEALANTVQRLHCGYSWGRLTIIAWLTSKNKHLPICYLVKFGSSAIKGVRINRKTPKFWAIWDPPLVWRRGWSPKNMPPPHLCYHVKFGRSATKSVCINIKEAQKFGRAGTPPLSGAWAWLSPKTSPLSICIATPNLVVLRQREYA